MAEYSITNNKYIFKTTKGLTHNHMLKKFPEYYEELNKYFSDNDLDISLSISEKIYLYQNGYDTIPICENIGCENNRKFLKFYRGYRTYCSRSCAVKHTHRDESVSKSRTEKIREYNRDPEKAKANRELSNKTKSLFSKEKILSINKKRNETCLKNHGIDSISKTNIKRKNIKKIDKRKVRLVETVRSRGFKYIDSDENELKLRCNICTCGKNEFIIDRGLFFRRQTKNIESCINKLPYKPSISGQELELIEYIKGLDIDYVGSDRSVLGGKELDIYLPDYNLAIELNGLYWHSSVLKDNHYHKNKTERCIEKNIDLIHIFEDEWYDPIKRSIVCSIIKTKTGNIDVSNKIYARSCIIKDIDQIIGNSFLSNNCLDHRENSYLFKGLYYNDKLVYVINYDHINHKIIGFCGLINHIVIGGFSRLIKSIGFKNIKIVLNRRFCSDNNICEKLFKNYTKNIIEPKCFYIDKTYHAYTRYNDTDNIRYDNIAMIYDSGYIEYIIVTTQFCVSSS